VSTTVRADHKDRASEARARRFLTAYVLFVVGLSSLLFIFNIGIVYSLTRVIESEFADLVGITGIVQFLLFVLPVALIFAQWYLWDILFATRYRS
jgi:hypothetical protein